MKDFKDRVAVVTGGASGMGLAFANKFADEGMKVVLADIDSEPLAMAEAGIKAKGVTVMAQKLDVANADAVQDLADRVFATFGNVHVLCSNAGVGGAGGLPSWELSLGDWAWVMGVNLWGPINGVRSFLPRMVANGDEGHIVNTASMAGMAFGGGVYGVTKHAVVALSESLYFELGRANSKIGVSVLCPGWVATNIGDSDRHRPDEYGAPRGGKEPLPGTEQMREWGKQMLASGYPPEHMAQVVFEGIRERKFYLIPAQATMLPLIKARHDAIQSQTNPEIVPFALPNARNQ